LLLRPPGSLSGTALQASPHGGGESGSVPSLLLVPALPYRPIPRRHRPGHPKYGVLPRRAPHAGDGGPGVSLRPRTPADRVTRRTGSDHQSRGAHGGGGGRGHRRRRAEGNPARECR
jgi:hypothetical protein